MSNNLIEVENIAVRYGNQVVLNNVSFCIEKGDYIGLVGANGSGKTTLAKAILGLIPLESGQIIRHNYMEHPLQVGYLPQVAVTGNQMFPAEVREIVGTGLLGQKKFPKRLLKSDKIKVDEILEKLDIIGLRHKRIGDLSGGQQQRVLLARAMVSNPQVLILDEPTSASDPRVRESFYNLIDEINKKEHTSILLVSHDLGSVKRYAQKMMLLDREIIFFGESHTFDDEFGLSKGLHHHGHYGGNHA